MQPSTYARRVPRVFRLGLQALLIALGAFLVSLFVFNSVQGATAYEGKTTDQKIDLYQAAIAIKQCYAGSPTQISGVQTVYDEVSSGNLFYSTPANFSVFTVAKYGTSNGFGTCESANKAVDDLTSGLSITPLDLVCEMGYVTTSGGCGGSNNDSDFVSWGGIKVVGNDATPQQRAGAFRDALKDLTGLDVNDPGDDIKYFSATKFFTATICAKETTSLATYKTKSVDNRYAIKSITGEAGEDGLVGADDPSTNYTFFTAKNKRDKNFVGESLNTLFRSKSELIGGAIDAYSWGGSTLIDDSVASGLVGLSGNCGLLNDQVNDLFRDALRTTEEGLCSAKGYTNGNSPFVLDVELADIFGGGDGLVAFDSSAMSQASTLRACLAGMRADDPAYCANTYKYVEDTTKKRDDDIFDNIYASLLRNLHIPIVDDLLKKYVTADPAAAKATLITKLATELEACKDGQGIDVGLGAPDITDPSGDGGSSCVIEGIGWIVCAPINALAGLNDAMYGWIKSILVLNPLQSIDSGGEPTPQYETWQRIRDISNILLVIGFLIIIFSQITGAGVSNYGVKKLLPRVVIVAIAINVSYFVMQLSIDAVNIIGVGLEEILKSTGVEADLADLNAGNIVGSMLAGTGITIASAGIAAAAIVISGATVSSIALLVAPFIIVSALGVFAAVATLFVRNAVIVILVVISPLAFAAYLLPNTEDLFTKWRKLFISMLMLFPMAALLFGGARFAAYTVLANDQALSALVALFIMGAPLFALPWLAGSTNSILKGINGGLQKLAKSAKAPLQRAAKPLIANQIANRKNDERDFLGRRRTPEQIAARQAAGKRNLSQILADRSRNLGADTEGSDKLAEENWRQRGLNPTTKTSQETQRVLDKKGVGANKAAANDEGYKQRMAHAINTPGTEEAADDTRRRDATKTIEMSKVQTDARFARRVRENAQSVTGSGGLLEIDNQKYAAEESEKADTLRVTQFNKESGAADVSIQDQKGAEQVIRKLDKEQNAVFETQNKDLAIDYEEKLADNEVKSAQERDEAAYQETLSTATEVAADNPLADQIERARVAQGEIETSNSRKASARRVLDNERAAELQSTPGLAQRAGGIDPQGESLVVAQAIETQRKAYDANVAAYGIRLKEQGVPSSIASVLGRPDQPGDESMLGISMDTSRTLEEQEAAGRAIVASGDIDSIKPYQNYLATALDAANRSGDTEQVKRVQALQKAYGETVRSSPGKPMGLGAADIAAFGTGSYLPPTPTRPIDTSGLSVSEIQTLNAVTDKGVSMDNWAIMDKSDIADISKLVQRGLIPPARLEAMRKTLEETRTDTRWSGRIKEREQGLLLGLENLIPKNPAP